MKESGTQAAKVGARVLNAPFGSANAECQFCWLFTKKSIEFTRKSIEHER